MAAADASRLAGLPPRAAALVRAATAALQRNQAGPAERDLRAALALLPTHAETLRLLAVALRLQRRDAEALDAARRAAAHNPDDALIQNGLATALDACGEREAAIAAFHRACKLAPQAAPVWANLGKTLGDYGRFEDAVPVLEKAVALSGHVPSHLRLAYALRVLGRTDAAAASYRELLARNASDGSAWLGLSSLRTRSFGAEDIAAMEAAMRSPRTSSDERISIGFALAKALDDHGRYAESFAVLHEANARVRAMQPWSAARFSALADAVLAAFARIPAVASGTQGEDVIFIVSMPRAGSSLTEHILASHPRVEGAGELDDLAAVIKAESQRRGQPFPQWVASASPADWQRLGAEYLRRTARWRHPGKLFTDKLPGNWLRLGAAMAMLPGARVIDCRRDPLEACFSCFRTLFTDGNAPTQLFSYDLADVGAHWRDYDRACRHWQALYPSRFRVQHYEDLVSQPEREIAALLAFCGLPDDPACHNFHETRRSVRTASASQVREPLMRDTARAARYGTLLDPLRAALGPQGAAC